MWAKVCCPEPRTGTGFLALGPCRRPSLTDSQWLPLLRPHPQNKHRDWQPGLADKCTDPGGTHYRSEGGAVRLWFSQCCKAAARLTPRPQGTLSVRLAASGSHLLRPLGAGDGNCILKMTHMKSSRKGQLGWEHQQKGMEVLVTASHLELACHLLPEGEATHLWSRASCPIWASSLSQPGALLGRVSGPLPSACAGWGAAAP